MNLARLIVPLGILTYLFLFSTALSGLLGVKIKSHKLLAITAITLATLHAGIIISRMILR